MEHTIEKEVMKLSDKQTNLMSLWMHMRRGFETDLKDSHVGFRVLNGIYGPDSLTGFVKGTDGHLYKVVMSVEPHDYRPWDGDSLPVKQNIPSLKSDGVPDLGKENS